MGLTIWYFLTDIYKKEDGVKNKYQTFFNFIALLLNSSIFLPAYLAKVLFISIKGPLYLFRWGDNAPVAQCQTAEDPEDMVNALASRLCVCRGIIKRYLSAIANDTIIANVDDNI